MPQKLFSSITLIASFLVFMVQPMLAKAIMPDVGGAASIWIVSMLFFQILLLAGYGYAAISTHFLTPKAQIWLHVILITITGLLFLPIGIYEQPIEGKTPEWWALTTLFLTISMPYFLLTANSTLMQRWYYNVHGKSPYHLFAISNVGSFFGLLGYPLMIEWMLTLDEQMLFWGVGLVIYGLLILALLKNRVSIHEETKAKTDIPPFSLGYIGSILLLGFIPSSLFLSTTLYVTTDIASMPMIWVVPLALYLLSFVVVFSEKTDAWVKKLQFAHILIVCPLLMLSTINLDIVPFVRMVFVFASFFVIAISVHGYAAAIKPVPERLPLFFFILSLGGALGGLFNTVAPHLFNDVYEFPLIILLSLLAKPESRSADTYKAFWGSITTVKRVMVSICLVAIILFTPYFFSEAKMSENTILKDRNFFGVSRVEYEPEANVITFIHGTTNHGFQSQDPEHRLMVNTYYVPLNSLLSTFPDSFWNRPFGVLGLGAGTLSCLGKEGQYVDFFEIDPLVIEIAENPELFTYTRDCAPKVRIYEGDGRKLLEEQDDNLYNLLVMDAFSSDSIPMHVITKEAVAMYAQKIHPTDGVIAFNISNRYLKLEPVLANIADSLGLKAYYLRHRDDPDTQLDAPSKWVWLLPKHSPWVPQAEAAGAELISPSDDSPLWTDSYSNILPALY